VSIATLALIFSAGFITMTPIGPVSTICIRRALLYGPRAGMSAGAGDAVAVALYATIGVTGSAILPRLFAPFATIWHILIGLALIGVAVLMWRSRPMLPSIAKRTRAGFIHGFGAALALALANPADIVLFAALFAGLGVAAHTPMQYALVL
jgi:putative LysE/RhtB family amino acid efflux pump